MRHDHAKFALLRGGGLVVEGEEQILVEIGPGVFHRARHDRRGDLVQLGEGEGLAEIVFEVADDALGAIEREISLPALGLVEITRSGSGVRAAASAGTAPSTLTNGPAITATR
jgi:hypothetical protein